MKMTINTRMTLVGLVVAGLLLATVPAVAEDKAAAPGIFEMLIERPSPLGFEETLTRLEANAKAEGWKVPSKWKVDFQQNLQRVTGKDIGPNRVLKMCEPEAAADILLKDQYKQLTAMMPCTIAVYVKSDGKTYVSMMNLDAMAQLYGGDVAQMAQKLGPQMDRMLKFD